MSFLIQSIVLFGVFYNLSVVALPCDKLRTFPRNTTQHSSCYNMVKLRSGGLYFSCSSGYEDGTCPPHSVEIIKHCNNTDEQNPQHLHFITECASKSSPINNHLPLHIFQNFNISKMTDEGCRNSSLIVLPLQNNTGIITSPYWPSDYRPFVSGACTWRIDVHTHTRLKVYYLYINLHHNTADESCSKNSRNDYLLFRGVVNNRTVKTDIFCASSPSMTKYYDEYFDTVYFSLVTNSGFNGSLSSRGFFIGIVGLTEATGVHSYFQYWWLVIVVVLALLGKIFSFYFKCFMDFFPSISILFLQVIFLLRLTLVEFE